MNINKLLILLQEGGYKASINESGYILIPMITRDENNKDVLNKKIEYFAAIRKGRLIFMLTTDISYVCGVESKLEELAELTARFMMNHNPDRLDLDMQGGVFAIRQIRKTGFFQTADKTFELFENFMGVSKKALQWIVNKSNRSLYNKLWPNESPREQIYLMEWNR